ncbi:hypothetical protein P691DRAFT_769575 [Macrolepiota fuliginosa MF-IS2]|uniref:Uncharacterized protein n=1 Tax=Macrolepiota fuliginosa MF-IS2 TaxID=1400762 RepID=A0A9P5WVR4_9AGAR|nr:hypothetical protein P691DRAFT_769575 [Macrolepiota fuliginosa MF-IS2]
MTYAIWCVSATFDIVKKLDGSGNPIEPRHEFESAVTSYWASTILVLYQAQIPSSRESCPRVIRDMSPQ